MDGANRYMLTLAEKVAITGEVLNVAESVEVEKGCGGDIKSLLAMPVRNSHSQIIGKWMGNFQPSFNTLNMKEVVFLLN